MEGVYGGEGIEKEGRVFHALQTVNRLCWHSIKGSHLYDFVSDNELVAKASR